MRGVCLVVCLLLCASLGAAQVYTDTFTSTSLLGWSMSGGTWKVTSLNQLQADPTRTYQYLAWDAAKAQNAAVEIKVFYNKTVAGLQFGGGALRFIKHRDCVMNKTQDNNSSGDFDRFYVYDDPGSSNYMDPKAHTSTVVRLLAIGTALVGRLDTDMDGKWDYTVLRTSTKTVVAGKAGISGYGGVLFDDFKYFDGVVRLHPKSPAPTPGATIGLQLGADAGETYQCAASFGNGTGINLIDGRRIPLDVDNLMVLSFQAPTVFGAFFGTLNSNGIGNATVAIPSVAALKGTRFYVGMVTLDPKSRTGIGNIANDFRVDIQ